MQYAEEYPEIEISMGVDLENHSVRRLYAKKGFIRVLFGEEDEQGKYQKLLKTLQPKAAPSLIGLRSFFIAS